MRLAVGALAFATLALGCAQGDMPCRVGADCASGVCLASGECMPVEGDEDAGPGVDAFVPGVDAGTDAATERDAGLDGGAARDAGPVDGGCGDGDGVLTRAELPLPLSVAIPRRVAFDVAFDSHGAERADGTRLWDFEGPFTGDEDRSDQRRPLDGAWFAEAFPGATYTLPLSAEEDLLGVYELTDDALLLRGVVSPEDGAFATELEYDPPAPVWELPLARGDAWDQTSTVSGLLNGVVTAYTERWQAEVDAAGEAGTPAGVRRVLRVNTLLTRTVGSFPTPARRHSYVEECVGTVAQVFGPDGDASEEPDRAVELWRVAP